MRIPKMKGSTVSHDRAPKQEQAATKRLGGKLVARSGAGPVKGDVRVQGVLRLEVKTTSRKSFSLTHHVIDQIEEAAVSTGEIPAIQVQFIDERGNVTRSVCIVPDYVLDEVVAYGASRKHGGASGGSEPSAAPDALGSVEPIAPARAPGGPAKPRQAIRERSSPPEASEQPTPARNGLRVPKPPSRTDAYIHKHRPGADPVPFRAVPGTLKTPRTKTGR